MLATLLLFIYELSGVFLQPSIDQHILTNGEMADEEISEDQESFFTEDGMEDLYDDESYLEDEDDNGLADVETDYDEDRYGQKPQTRKTQMKQQQQDDSQNAMHKSMETNK